MILNKVPLTRIEQAHSPKRRTIRRWKQWLYDKFIAHSNTLRARFSYLGKGQSIETFWFTCFKQMSLATAMFYVHQGGEVVP
jgi:hypothetical protein